MKTVIAFLVFAAAASTANAQWVWQNPLPQGNPLYNMFFLDTKNGWACGGYGGDMYGEPSTLIHTTNGGRDWSTIFTGLGGYMWDIQFNDANNGWCIFGNPDGGGCLRRTTDGGRSWEAVRCGVYDAVFPDLANGWVLDWIETDTTIGMWLFQTTNAGRSWVRHLADSSVSGDKIFFVERNVGWVFGGASAIHTTNGGNSWIPQTVGIPPQCKVVAADFADNLNGWVTYIPWFGGSGGIRHTTNGGETWIPQAIPGQTSYGPVQFANNYIGWVLCGQNLFRTSNGGASWDQQSIPANVQWWSMRFASASNGWMLGSHRWSYVPVILHTSNGGNYWEEQSHTVTTKNLNSVHFSDRDNGWAVGDSGTIIRTSNGGSSWSVQQSGTRNRLSAVYSTHQSISYAVGDSGKVLKTTDGGNNWIVQSVLATTSLNAIQFVELGSGWIVGAGGKIFRTTNSGAQWIAQTSPVTIDLKCVFFRDRYFGWAAGANVILYTYDGGSSWRHRAALPSEGIEGIQFLDANTGWVSGKNMLFGTTDGGYTWTQSWGCLGPSYFIDSNKGWCVGYRGIGGNHIRSTTDGGITWQQQPSGFGWNLLNSAFFVSANNGWFVGQSGTILHTSNGGVTSVNAPKFRELPTGFALEQNYPNPFNPKTTINYQLPTINHVTLKVFDLLGREVATLVDEVQEAGYKSVQFEAGNLASGVYLYRLTAGSFAQTNRMLVLK